MKMIDDVIIFLNLKLKYSSNKIIYLLKENKLTKELFKTINYDDKLIFSLLNIPLLIIFYTFIAYAIILITIITPLFMMNKFTFETFIQSILLLSFAYGLNKNELTKVTELENYAINVINFNKSLYLKLNYILKQSLKSIAIVGAIYLVNNTYNIYYFTFTIKSFMYLFLYCTAIFSLMNFPVKNHIYSNKGLKMQSFIVVMITYLLIVMNVSLDINHIEYSLILISLLNCYFLYFLIKKDLSHIEIKLGSNAVSKSTNSKPLFISSKKGQDKYEELFFERNKNQIKIPKREYYVYMFLLIILYYILTTNLLSYIVIASVQFETFAWIFILLLINKTNTITKYYYELSDKYLINYSMFNKNWLKSFNSRLKDNLSLNLKSNILLAFLICVIYFLAHGRLFLLDTLLIILNFSVITFIITYYNLGIYYLYMEGLNVKSSRIKYNLFKWLPLYFAYYIMNIPLTLLHAFGALVIFMLFLIIIIRMGVNSN